MFSGIVKSLGKISGLNYKGNDLTLCLEVDLQFTKDINLGDSICVNGCCLTVVRCENNLLLFDLSQETLGKTMFSDSTHGDIVNLEKSLTLSDKLDGHLVTGHIDGVAKLSNLSEVGESIVMVFSYDNSLAKFIAKKGSVTINGVSLTINEVFDDRLSVNIIPYTASHTNLGNLRLGSLVNIEVDIIARYVDRMNFVSEKVSDKSKELIK